ncbi:MAG: GNAT family N-acetyltransferase [Paracoccaceae bacterium]
MTPDELAALHHRCFAIPRPWSAAEFASYATNPLAFVLVEGDAGALVGRAVAGEAEILTLAVAPEARRRGLASRLVARFVYQARLRGAVCAFLEVSAENGPAMALYESAGFAVSGLRRGYYSAPDGRKVDAQVMTRDL